MILQYLSDAIVWIGFSSWLVGMILNEVLRKTEFYKKHLSNLNLIKSETLNKKIGLEIFKWMVINTFFKYCNQLLKLKSKKSGITELNELRKRMTNSEVSHLIGFVYAAIFAFVKFIYGNYLFGLIIMMVNILMNLYPSLLQQENKKRIDKMIKNYAEPGEFPVLSGFPT